MSGRFDRRHGWHLYQHPAFGGAYDRLVAEVRALAGKNPARAPSHPKAKLLRRINELILDEIPRDPGGRRFRLGKTLGAGHGHWRRAKFLGRFRLFFRYSSRRRIIIYAWLNDETTLRQAEGRRDPYAIFAKRLIKGDPPDDWDALTADLDAADSEAISNAITETSVRRVVAEPSPRGRG